MHRRVAALVILALLSFTFTAHVALASTDSAAVPSFIGTIISDTEAAFSDVFSWIESLLPASSFEYPSGQAAAAAASQALPQQPSIANPFDAPPPPATTTAATQVIIEKEQPIIEETPASGAAISPSDLRGILTGLSGVVALIPSAVASCNSSANVENQIAALQSAISNQSYSASASPPLGGGASNTIAAANAIDQLSGTTISNPMITGGSIANASVSGGPVTATSLSVSGSTSLSGDLSVGGNLTAGSLSFSAASSTSVIAINSTTTNSTSTNFYSSSLVAGNGSIASLITTGATSTNLFSTLANFTTAIASTFNASIANIVGFTATNSTTTNATTTNLYAASAVIPTLSTTNATSTKSFATTASSTNLFANTGSIGSLGLGTLTALAATSTNFFATTASSTNLFSQSASFGSLLLPLDNCSTYANGGKLTTDAFGNVLCAADQSSGSGQTVAGANGQLQFDAYGSFGASSNLSFSTTTNTLTTTNATFTNATTTSLGINGQAFTNLLGTGLGNTGGVLTVSLSPFTTSNLAEGSNLYFTNARVASVIAGTTTDALAEGTANKYFTNARAQSAISVSGLPLMYSAGVIGINQSNASQNGFLASADWTNFNGKLASTSPSAGMGISYNSSTGVIGNTGVTSVAASGGSTGLTFTGSPVTTSGTITLGGTLGIGNGGSNATSFTQGQLLSFNGTSFVSTSTIGNNQLANSSLTVSAGSGLSGGASVSLGGSASLSLNVGNANNWTGLQSFANASNTLATLGTTWLSGLSNTLLGTNGSGQVVATTSIGTNYITGVLGTVNGTSFSRGGSITVTAASSTLLSDNDAFSGNDVFSSPLSLSATSGTTTIASGQGFTIGGPQFVVQQGSGNVGIGTTSPFALLSVNGNGYFSGSLTATALDGDTSAAEVTATGGTTARTMAARAADVINAADYGVVCDYNFTAATGTDNTIALENAISAAETGAAQGIGKQLILPAGACLTGPQIISGQIYMSGSSGNGSVLVLKSGSDSPALTILSSGYNFPSVGYPSGEVVLEHLRVTSVNGKNTSNTDPAASGIAINLTGAWSDWVHLSDDTIYGMPGDGIDGNGGDGLATLDQVSIINNGGVGLSTNSTNDWDITGLNSGVNYGDNVLSSGDSQMAFHDLNAYSSTTGHGVHLYGKAAVNFDSHIELNLNAKAGLYLDDLTSAARVTVIGPVFGGNSYLTPDTYGAVEASGGSGQVTIIGADMPAFYTVNSGNSEAADYEFINSSASTIYCSDCTYEQQTPNATTTANVPAQVINTGYVSGTGYELSNGFISQASSTVVGAGTITGAATVGSLIDNAATANSLLYSNGSKQDSSVTLGSYLSLTTGTLATDATNLNTASTIVARDGSGNFSAGTITANLTGTASTVTTDANLTGPITSTGNATAVASQTGTGSTFVMQASPTLTTPNLGTPSAGVLTNATGLPLTSGVSGILPIANGGTDIASQTSNGVNYFDGTHITSGSSLTWNGTTFAASNISTGGTLGVTGLSTLTGGFISQASSTVVGTINAHTMNVTAENITNSQQYTGLAISNGTNIIGTIRGYSSNNDVGVFDLLNGGTTNVQLSAGTGYTTNFITGNLGIGTTTPYSRLEVFGPDSASSTSAFAVVSSASSTVFAVFDGGNAELSGTLTQSSDQRLKTNIQDLDGSSSLAEINALNPVTFNWIDPEKDGRTQFGFIAQQVQGIFPSLVSTTSPTALTPNGTLGLNYIDLLSPIVAAIQELDKEVMSVESTVAGFAQSITTAVLNATTGNFGQVNTSELCVQGTCVTGSQLQALLAAANQSGSTPASLPSTSTPEATDTPPMIQINGDNPAIIQVGTSYTDLGATISGPEADLNLGIQTYLNGTLENPIELDTSSAATDTIAYVVTDSQGLTSTSTRTVIVEPAAAQTAPPPVTTANAGSTNAASSTTN